VDLHTVVKDEMGGSWMVKQVDGHDRMKSEAGTSSGVAFAKSPWLAGQKQLIPSEA
jgi:hypothetical protein